MTIDLNQYIGVPYLNQGRTAKGWDCYGLVKELYRLHKNITLPDWQVDAYSRIAVAHTMTSEISNEVNLGYATQVIHPIDWDIVTVARHRAAHHIGLYMQGGVLHCASAGRTQWNEWSKFQRLYLGDKVRCYRWLR